MSIYIYVCQLYFIQGVAPIEIAEYFKDELLEYEHQVHDHAIKYTNPETAVKAIIDCEKQSHFISKHYEY